MIIRLRWKYGGGVARDTSPGVVEIHSRAETGTRRDKPESAEPELVTSEEMARGLSELLWPASTVPMALAIWRVGQDLGFARDFFLQDGIASRWQVWLALSLAMMAAARYFAKWKAPQPKPKSSARPTALEVFSQPALVEPVHAEQSDGHPRRRFGNLR